MMANQILKTLYERVYESFYESFMKASRIIIHNISELLQSTEINLF